MNKVFIGALASGNCECVLYKVKAGGCSALTRKIALRMWDDGKCGTIECPFYKPGAGLARVGDDFKPYTEKQKREMEFGRRYYHDTY